MEELSRRLQKVQSELQDSDKSLQKISQNIKDNPMTDADDKELARNEFYSYMSKYEADYQRANDDYKELISKFSKPYLQMSDFYVGPELPRHSFLSSKEDVYQLYGLFVLLGIATIFGYTDKDKEDKEDKNKDKNKI
jgi:hypothetical protein